MQLDVPLLPLVRFSEGGRYDRSVACWLAERTTPCFLRVSVVFRFPPSIHPSHSVSPQPTADTKTPQRLIRETSTLVILFRYAKTSAWASMGRSSRSFSRQVSPKENGLGCTVGEDPLMTRVDSARAAPFWTDAAASSRTTRLRLQS